MVRLAAALFPVAQRPQGNLMARSELFLVQVERTAQRFDLRDAPQLFKLALEREIVWVGAHRRLDFVLQSWSRAPRGSPFWHRDAALVERRCAIGAAVKA